MADIIEYRDIICPGGHTLGQLGLPVGTSEQIWEAKLAEYEHVMPLSWDMIRSTRDKLISASDWYVLRHKDELDLVANLTLFSTTLSAAQYLLVLDYRNTLRGITAYLTPEEVIWPVLSL